MKEQVKQDDHGLVAKLNILKTVNLKSFGDFGPRSAPVGIPPRHILVEDPPPLVRSTDMIDMCMFRAFHPPSTAGTARS